MTPIEKARELVDKFTPLADSGMEDSTFRLTENAKKCALICVDEILQASTIKLADSRSGKFVYIDDYWQQVKSSITTL